MKKILLVIQLLAIAVIANSQCGQSVSIVVSPSSTVCAGTSVTFTATPVNAGTPTYHWTKNGSAVGTNSATYGPITPANGDQVRVTMSSSSACCTTAGGCSDVNSNTITMTVNPMTTPTVSVSQSPQGQICSKTSVTFTATAGTAGPSPSYQWKINGNNVGTNSSTFTNGNWYNNDVVSVVVTSNDPCPTTPTATAQVTESVSISPSDVITPIGPTRFCQNGHVVLSAGSTGNALDVNGGKASVGAGAYDVDVNNFTVEAWFYARANTLGTIVA